ncbi:MAG: ATP-binding cassette domain-containing protein [Ruminococcaceae bacterium]|nr:ATP-binding cassette domain-containing protein [Oscillospiraceae bacterium]
MIYLKKLYLPSEHAEIEVIKNEQRTCFHTFYPFKIFPEKKLSSIEFDGITMLYGGNGSGKSTLLNVLASKIQADRYSEFNSSPFFDKFVQMCYVDYARTPKRSYVLTSDDVFDYALKARLVNEGIDDERNELIEKYIDTHREAVYNPEITRFHGLDDYERWKTAMEILSPKRSQSSYIKKRVAQDIKLNSNGETAMRYFLERIDEDAVYLLDEPENSLSVEFQIQLAEYISATARATQSQFIIATHSPILLSMQNAKIYNLDAYPASTCHWTELDNVRRYFDFFMEHKEEFN